MDNNKAFVAYLENITRIPNADKIVSADVVLHGVKQTQVVTGIDTKPHTKVVYFDSNLCIDAGIIADYPDIGTYLARGGRIRVIKLKGVISNGLAVEVSKFFKYAPDAEKLLQEGYAFDKIGEKQICRKYMPVNLQQHRSGKARKRTKSESRVIAQYFHFHFDTEQLTRNAHKIHPDDIISISRKIHGTSAITAHVPIKRTLSLRDRIAKYLGVDVNESEFGYLYASRTVVKNARKENDSSKKNFYGVDLWSCVGKAVFEGKLHKGETAYYEIVGYIPGSNSPIQRVGKCDYNYGCIVGEYKIAVYRMTMSSIGGTPIEYSWDKLKSRCAEIQVPMVHEYYYGRAKDLFPELSFTEHWNENFVSRLKLRFLGLKATDCVGSPPDEGIVIRVEKPEIECYKLKDEKFLLAESGAKDKGEVVDVEEQDQILQQGLADAAEGRVSEVSLEEL